VASAGIERHVQFVGAIAPEDLGNWYRAADLCLLSSDSEGLPNVLRESLACGTPYVTTDVGDIREIDGGQSGVFVPKGDVRQLSAAILASLDERMSRVEPQQSRTWRDMADEITSLFESQRKVKAPHPGPLPHVEASSNSRPHRGGEGDTQFTSPTKSTSALVR
jgi:glycosyltransferase involved in cell wall biosynthesis